MIDRLLIASEPGRYGVLIYVRNLIRFLHARHPEIGVDLAYSSRRGSPALRELVEQVVGRGGEAVDLEVGNGPEPGDLRALGRLAALVRRRRPALIHAHSSKAGALARMLGIVPAFPPVLYSPHGYYGMSRRGGVKEAVFDGIEAILGQTGSTHHVSSYERDFALGSLGLPGRSQILVYSGIDLSLFSPASPEARLACRRALGLPESGRLLVTVGRDAYEKNYAPLYRALDRLLPGADWSFAHAGQGSEELRMGLGAAARDRVFPFAYLEKPELLLRAADGFILTSRSEAFGLAAYEALACGLPLILTASTGLLSIRRLGFTSVRWLPDPASAGNIDTEVETALGEWARQPSAPPPDQSARLHRWFDETVQFEKLIRLYRAIVH